MRRVATGTRSNVRGAAERRRGSHPTAVSRQRRGRLRQGSDLEDAREPALGIPVAVQDVGARYAASFHSAGSNMKIVKLAALAVAK